MRDAASAGAEPAEIVDLAVDGAIAGLLDRFCGPRRHQFFNQRTVLNSVLANALQVGARTAVVERRYTDVDYRDEHSLFYAKTFRQYPATAQRVHFFKQDPPARVFEPDVAASFDDMEYLGYCVLRPVAGAAVGRTMIVPPTSMARAITCRAVDRVNFFGHEYTVEAVPFMAQDHQLGVCAHAASWMVSYFHTLRYGNRRILPGDIADSVQPALTMGRRVPNRGLATEQLSDILEGAGLPAIVYRTDGSSLSARDAERFVRHYLDSAIPVIVGTRSHTFVAVGYETQPQGHAHFVCQDDERGPYRVFKMPANPAASDAWQYLIVPAPDQLYVTCEEAEVLGRVRMLQELENPPANQHPDQAALEEQRKKLLADLTPERGRPNTLEFVTSAVESNEFKRTLIARGYPEQAARAYMRLPMSKWVWVVEIVDCAAFADGVKSVLAEAIIDSTCHARDMQLLAWRLPGKVRHWDTDTDRIGDFELPHSQDKGMSICATSGSRKVRRQ